MRRGGCTERRLRHKMTGQKRGFGPAFLSKQFTAHAPAGPVSRGRRSDAHLWGSENKTARGRLPRACPKIYFDWRTRGCSGGAEGDRGMSISAHLNDRAFPLFSESRKCSISLFSRNSERKTAVHFCWNCSSRQSDRHIGQHIVRGVNSSKYRSRPADDIRRRIVEGAVERLDQRGIAGADHRRVCGEKLLRPHLAIAVVEQAHEK